MLVWDSSYSVKVTEIDDQHKIIIEFINDLERAISEKDTSQTITGILKGLFKYTVDHFAIEEQYFRRFNYAKTELHIHEHQQLVKRVNQYVADFEMSLEFDAEDFLNFLRDWLIDHIMSSDKEYIQCFTKNGLK